MSGRGIQIEGNVFCSVCECYMSQEIICNRKTAETQDSRAFIARIVTVQSCGVSGGFYASDPGQTDPVAIFTMKVPDSGCVERHACMAKHKSLGRASRYEQKSHRSETTGAICEYRRRLRECEARSNRLSCMVVSASADIAVLEGRFLLFVQYILDDRRI